mmetsp:Transcript_127288/g.249417  ORF Transcript_127288/g.249417 Transcript_127288/m.249417 type:complete len:242 (-) Transcript_127288:241-966(-)
MAPAYRPSIQPCRSAGALDGEPLAPPPEYDDEATPSTRDGSPLPQFLTLLGPLWKGDASPFCGRGAHGGSDTRELEQEFVGRWVEWEKSGKSLSSKKLRKKQNAEEVRAEALRIVTDFCHQPTALRAEPGVEGLNALFQSCYRLPTPAVAVAMREQLSWSSGNMEWQPRLRVVCAMIYFVRQDAWGEEVVRKVVEQAGDTLEHLAQEVPQCTTLTLQLLEILGGPRVDRIQCVPDHCGVCL